MLRFFRLWLGSLFRCFHTRESLLLENLALRQQLSVLKRKHPSPRIGAVEKFSGYSPVVSGVLGSTVLELDL